MALLSLALAQDLESSKTDMSLYQPAGLHIQIKEHSIDVFLKTLQKFLPHYLKYDIKLDKPQVYEFSMFFGYLRPKLILSGFEYDEPVLDLTDTKITLINDNRYVMDV